MNNERIKSILEESGILEKVQLEDLFNEAERKKQSLYDLIVSRDLAQDFYLGKVLADGLGYPFVSLSRVTVPDEVLQVIPEIVSKKQKIIAFALDNEGLKLAMANPDNDEIKEFIEKKVGADIIPYFATERDLSNALVLYRKDVSKTLEDILNPQRMVAIK